VELDPIMTSLEALAQAKSSPHYWARPVSMRGQGVGLCWYNMQSPGRGFFWVPSDRGGDLQLLNDIIFEEWEVILTDDCIRERLAAGK
jgi:hypothetical protein